MSIEHFFLLKFEIFGYDTLIKLYDTYVHIKYIYFLLYIFIIFLF